MKPENNRLTGENKKQKLQLLQASPSRKKDHNENLDDHEILEYFVNPLMQYEEERNNYKLKLEEKTKQIEDLQKRYSETKSILEAEIKKKSSDLCEAEFKHERFLWSLYAKHNENKSLENENWKLKKQREELDKLLLKETNNNEKLRSQNLSIKANSFYFFIAMVAFFCFYFFWRKKRKRLAQKNNF